MFILGFARRITQAKDITDDSSNRNTRSATTITCSLNTNENTGGESHEVLIRYDEFGNMNSKSTYWVKVFL